MIIPEVAWQPAASADETHDDEELDLASLGNPGDAQWAWIAAEDTPAGQTWCWAIYHYWLWEDIDKNPNAVLAEGKTDSKPAAKEAVQVWVNQATREPLVYHKDGCTGLIVDQYGNTKEDQP